MWVAWCRCVGLSSALRCVGSHGSCLPGLGIGRNLKCPVPECSLFPMLKGALGSFLLGQEHEPRLVSSEFSGVSAFLMVLLSCSQDLGTGSFGISSVRFQAQAETSMFLPLSAPIFLYSEVTMKVPFGPGI